MIKFCLVVTLSFCFISTSYAEIVEVSLTRLSGAVAQDTAMFRADLSSIGADKLLSITLIDSNSMFGGAPGQYSGFDLDAIKLTRTFTETAEGANNAISIDEFDFSPNGTIFTPGTQRNPVDQKLNGTDDTGLAVDSTFATLDLFDAIFFGTGSVTLGDGGQISFNLNNAVSTDGLYLYLGEVSGGQGEGLNGALSITTVQIPTAIWLFSSAAIVLFGIGKRKSRGQIL